MNLCQNVVRCETIEQRLSVLHVDQNYIRTPAWVFLGGSVSVSQWCEVLSCMGLMPQAGLPIEKQVLDEGMINRPHVVFPCPDAGHRGPPLEPGLEMGLNGEHLMAKPNPCGPTGLRKKGQHWSTTCGWGWAVPTRYSRARLQTAWAVVPIHNG